jgi:hypothetical protein
MCLGGALVVGGLWLIAKQKIITDTKGHSIDIDIPFFGKIKTNYPSVTALFLGTFLIWLPIDKWSSEPDRIPVSGQVIVEGRQSHDGVIVGIIPGSHKTFTHNDGSYNLDISRGETSYTGVAYYREGNQKDVYLGGVNFDTNKGTFNAALRRRP